jgi:hypothetical protein
VVKPLNRFDILNNDTKIVSEVILGVGALVQVILLLKFVILPLATNIWHVRDLPNIERSARLAFGDEFAEFIDFVKDQVPLDATVIIPHDETDIVLGNVGIMQYFLLPRAIADCAQGAPLPGCILALGGPDLYILAVDDFPPTEEASRTKDYLPFDDDRGLYIPKP